jgi:hypothetical protein
MKLNKRSILVIGMAFMMAAAFSSCARDKVGVPDATGPSTLATLLEMGASPNVIAAGKYTRQSVSITANLFTYDGQPVSNTGIHFELRDAYGFKAEYGFLENSQTTVSKTTDSSGRVTLTYHGPFTSELDVFDNFVLYVYAYVGWQGKEEISELCPIRIIGDVLADLDLEFELQAFPNVLWCTSTRPTSLIRGIFTYQNGVPMVGRKVFFSIQSGPGEFADGYAKTFGVTDANGIAEVTYIGPTKSEITGDTNVTIEGQPETDFIHVDDPYDPNDEADKYYFHKAMILRLIRGTGSN